MASDALADAELAAAMFEDTAPRLDSVVERARAGARDAMEQLYRGHRDLLAARVLRMTGDASAVDDLVQDVFIAAFTHMASFRGDAAFDSWLYRIAVNRARSWWAREARRRARELDARSSGADQQGGPHEALESTRRVAQLYGELAALPADLREAFTIRYIEGLGLREAAELLNAPVSTVSHRARTAYDRLCASLDLGDASNGEPTA